MLFPKSLFKFIKNILSKNIPGLIILLLMAFLRLYRLEEFATFLSDQGRDAIIARDIITLKHLTAIGAPSSIGQVFLGPFYYYLTAPFLLLFNFNPVGMTFSVALFSILGLFLFYFILKREKNFLTAFIFTCLAGFSYVLINLSRFSWNPNLLPTFAFASVLSFYLFIKEKKLAYAMIFGTLISLSIQLHYLGIFLIIPLIIVYTIQLFLNKQEKKLILGGIIAIVFFIIFISPLIFFDLKHEFINSKNLIELLTKQNLVEKSSLGSGFIDTSLSFLNIVFGVDLPRWSAYLFILSLSAVIIFSFKNLKRNLFELLNALVIVSFILAFSKLNSFRHPHYFGVIYYSFFYLAAYLLTFTVGKRRNFIFISIVVLIGFFSLNYRYYDFIFGKGVNQIAYSKRIASFLSDKIGNRPYNIATWPVSFNEDNYVYFLDLLGKRPADRKNIEITNQMIVLCHDEPCLVIDSPSWNISMFGKAKIDKIWKIEDLTVYKLVHDKK